MKNTKRINYDASLFNEKVDKKDNWENNLNVCNGCNMLNFATKTCHKDSPKKIVSLDTYVNPTGYIKVLKPSTCDR